MAGKSKAKIKTDLVSAGVDEKTANVLSNASGHRGKDARKFIRDNQLDAFEISKLGQTRLFEITYSDEESVARRVCQSVKDLFGECNWDQLDPAIRDLLVDLKYRGDYTPTSRKSIQKLIVANDLEGLATVMADRQVWKRVPIERFRRRKAYMEKVLTKHRAQLALELAEIQAQEQARSELGVRQNKARTQRFTDQSRLHSGRSR